MSIKVRGLHLKAVAADRRVALVGSFNFREEHIVTNYEFG